MTSSTGTGVNDPGGSADNKDDASVDLASFQQLLG